MSLCRAVRHPVTSSATLLRCVNNKPPTAQRIQALRLFSSYGSSYRSSKRDMQTATAYRPHTLPSSFPPPQTGPGSSVPADFPPMPESANPTQKTQQPETSSNTNAKEAEALPSKRTSATPTAKSTEKPRRKLRPRKAALKLSPLAIQQLHKLLSQPDPKLIRVGVKNRGCSGLAYHLEYVEKPGSFDEVVEQDGVKVLIDSKALFSIIGSEMDWQEDKLSQRFVFRNPNIKEECGCGESFMV